MAYISIVVVGHDNQRVLAVVTLLKLHHDNGGGGLALQCTHLEDAFLGKKP